jgi:DNA repair protein RecN (Recombination protein N)
MLKHLHVTNFAILSEVAIDFGPGMNVLTGETGAGKSLIVDAVALLRGGRARADIPRAGADEAVVEALFEPPPALRRRVAAALAEAGLPFGGPHRAPPDGGRSPLMPDEVVVRRVIARGGRSRVHVNGALTTAAALAQVGGLLIDLAGQHEHQALSDGARHGEILDAFGVDPALVERAGALWERLAELTSASAVASSAARARAEREDFLRYQLDEIEAAKVAPGEERELGAERDRLRAAGKLGAAARHAEDALYAGDGAAVDLVAGVLRELSPLAAIDPRLDPPRAQLEEARALLEDAAVALRRYAETVRDDPARLIEIEDRLHLLGRLARKHGDDILGRAAALRAELAELTDGEERSAARAKELETVSAETRAVAAALSDARTRAGRRLARAAEEALAELGTAGAKVDPRIERRELGPRGWDRVELLLSANRGEEPKPLARVASGGELSRIMLALKLALRAADPVATHVFDEVDAGVGGATAEVVGRQIRKVADERQVICVTHLAQIAAFADTHFRVEKQEKDGRVETSVERLGKSDRREEVARMIGGIKITPKARAHAEELLRGR